MDEGKITGVMDDLLLFDPPDSDLDLWKGESKILVYKIKNPSYHVIKNLDFTANTYIHSKEQGDLSTKVNYAKVLGVPDTILPNETVEIKVKVDIPDNYNETIKYEGHEIEYPFRLAIKTKAIKAIREL